MAGTAAVAAGYSPINGLLGRDTSGAGAGLGGAFSPAPVSFNNPNAPTNPGAQGAPAGVAGSITGAGAYTPDWASLIQNDAGLKDAAAALAAGGAQNQSQLGAEIANAYEGFGKNIDVATLAQQLGMTQADLQNILTPDVQRLAQENTAAGLSTTARLQQANDNAVRAIMANLNKRGILHSGEAGYQLNQQNQGYRQAQFDSTAKLLDYLQKYQQGYLTAQQANSQKLADAYSGAANRQYTVNQSTPGVTATLDHIDASGRAVYKDPSGNLFNADGSAYVATPPTATPPVGAGGDYGNVPGLGQPQSRLRGGGQNVRLV